MGGVLTGAALLLSNHPDVARRARSEIDQQDSGEQFVTVENSMGVVTQSRGTLTPASKHLKSEVAVIADLAEANAPDAGFASRLEAELRDASARALARQEVAAAIEAQDEDVSSDDAAAAIAAVIIEARAEVV